MKWIWGVILILTLSVSTIALMEEMLPKQVDLYVPREADYVFGFANESTDPAGFSTIIIGGDVMLDRNVRKQIELKGYEEIFKHIRPVFDGADLVVINLEGPITSNRSRTLLNDGRTTKSFTFTFATSSAIALARAGVDIVSLANNHSINFGSEGLSETKKWLDEAGIQWFGSPYNNSSSSLVKDVNGIRVGFVGYHQFSNGLSNVLQEIGELSSSTDFVIVYPHWGDEYVATSSSQQRELAHKFIEKGADLVVGSHPHVIQNMEYIDGKSIYYSLGNLIFDQYFSDEVMHGALLEITLLKQDNGNASIFSTRTLDVNIGREEITVTR